MPQIWPTQKFGVTLPAVLGLDQHPIYGSKVTNRQICT